MNWSKHSRRQRNKTLRRFVEGAPINNTFAISLEAVDSYDFFIAEVQHICDEWYKVRHTTICIVDIQMGQRNDDFIKHIATVLVIIKTKKLL